MTSATLVLLLMQLLFSTSIPTVAHQGATKSTQEYPADDDQMLKKAWTQFAKAVVRGDKKAIRYSSTNCVLFPASEYPKSASSNGPYISIDRFITELSPTVFDANTKGRLLDSTKLIFHDNKQNKWLYRYSCISNVAEFNTATIPEILVTTIEESNLSGGLQKAFAFIKTKSGYKFCGYSTIP